ncbi:hypothetical protein KEJ39_02835 [Candidatus Bathyarchaeota archaeon]|nr:hypothetical protein [Candidatus Bathyarchaeota archaeon]
MHHPSICACILLVLTLHFSVLEPVGAGSDENLAEGFCWTYQITSRTESAGTGSYVGQARIIEDVRGEAVVKRLNATILMVEDHRMINRSSFGAGFFRQDVNVQATLRTVSSIDRTSLRVVNQETEGDLLEDGNVYNSKRGMPTVYFASTLLKRGQEAHYYWGGQVIKCFADEGTISLHGRNISVIILRYSGPKKVMIQTVTRFPEDGSAEANFYFERDTGLLVLYTAREEATFRAGACCAVTTTHIEDYQILTSYSLKTELPENATGSPSASPSSKPIGETEPREELAETQEPEYSLVHEQYLWVVAVTAVILIGLTYTLIRRRRDQTLLGEP